MVNHRGRCYHLYYIKVADVIAILLCVADGKPHMLHATAFEDGRCYCQVANEIATAGWVAGRSTTTIYGNNISQGIISTYNQNVYNKA